MARKLLCLTDMDVQNPFPDREFEAYAPPAVPLGNVGDWFDAGNFCGAAATAGHPWQRAAALGLIGNPSALAELDLADSPTANFYLAAALWIEGNDSDACTLLRKLDMPAAQRLLGFIEKPVIEVLAQTVWENAAFADDKFRVHRTGIKRTRLNEAGDLEPNNEILESPFLSIRDGLDFAPDFYFAHMIEWQYLPYDLTKLDCPTFGTTSDLDLHIQNNAPWLPGFDEVITVGAEEWAKARGLRSGPVCTFPKLFGIDPAVQLDVDRWEREVDVFFSGTMCSPYHPDKAALLHELLSDEKLSIRYMNGFLPPWSYVAEMTKAKAAFTFVRHPGSMPSRGVEALAAGCAVVVQEGSALELYAGENEGVFSYAPGQLANRLREVIRRWDDVAPQARRGAELMRRDFTGGRCISQFLRFLTVRAALHGSARPRCEVEVPHQKRVIAKRGWLYPGTVNYRLLKHTTEEAQAKEAVKPRPHHAIDAARELGLYLLSDLPQVGNKLKGYNQLMEDAQRQQDAQSLETLSAEMRAQAREIFRHGIRSHPESLVLRFNSIRHDLHLGSPEDVEPALAMAREILAAPEKFAGVDPHEDVMPWDYFGAQFNYRSFLDTLTAGLTGDGTDTQQLKELILAALAHYLGQYSGEVARLEDAVRWDPEFAQYRFSLARALLLRHEPGDADRAGKILEQLFVKSIFIEPAFRLMAGLREFRGVGFDRWLEHEQRVRRLQQITSAPGQAHDVMEEHSLIRPPGMDALPIQADPFADQPANYVGTAQSAQLACTPGRSGTPGKVLLISFECGDWENAKGWSYNGFYALEDALGAQGIRRLTLPAIAGIGSSHAGSWLRQAELFTRGEKFDQVWIWITHNDYAPEFLQWLEDVAPVRVGLVMESLEHTAGELAESPTQAARRGKVLDHLKHCTHALTFDEQDAAALPDALPIEAMWCPPVVSWRDVCGEVTLPAPGPAFFQGNLYNADRQAYLQSPELAGLLEQPPSPEADSELPQDFDKTQILSIERLMQYDVAAHEWLEEYLAQIRDIRRQLNDHWQASLRRSFAQVNLPSIFKSFAGRVVETMAAGRPVISWNPPRERTRALFTPGREILLFDRDNPAELAEHIRWLQANPTEAAAMAARARAKVLAYHTAEARVRQMLDWIAHGTEPDFGENTDLSIEPQTNGTDMNTNNPNQTDSLESILNQAEACHEREDHAGAIAALEQALEISDRHPVLLRALGTQLYLSKQFAAARESFAEFTTACADDATGHVQYGLAAFHDGDEEACVAGLQQALALDPTHPEALKLAADLDVRGERYAEASAKYDAIAAQGGITAEALHALAFCQFKTGEAERAQDTYRQLLTFDAEDELANHNLEVITKYLAAPQSEAPAQPAKESLDQAEFFAEAGNPEAALAELERAVDLEPNNPRLVEALGSALYQRDRFEEARRLFRRLIELSPRDALAYTRLAMTSHATDRFDEFESALGLAMEIDPELPEMLHFMAKVNLEQERFYDAGRIFSKLVELEPENVQNLLALAMCLFRGGQEEAAEATYERALELEPENEIARTNLEAMNDREATAPVAAEEAPVVSQESPLSELLQRAQAALERGEAHHAIALLENVLSQHPNEVALLTALGNLYFHEGQLKEALEYFRRNANLQPTDVDTQLQAATTALLVEEIEPFEVFMKRALEMDPDNAHGLKLLATANFKAGKFVEAAQLYAKAMVQMPEDLEIILALGVSFHRLNDAPTAEVCFRRALEVDPYNAVAAENLKAIAGDQPPAPGVNGEVSSEQVREIQKSATESDSPLPPVALIGSLETAQRLLAEGRHAESAREALAAIQQRPFHPEAILHLAEVALDAGDEAQAKQYLEAVKTLTPKWETPLNALASLESKPSLISTTIEWPTLPTPAPPRLSVCFIVKDEEQSLPKALDSIREIADQVVVVDTGSTDRTTELARAAGAEVHAFAWCDDFAAARNVALEHARGDWVLVLDADEILPAESIDALRADLARDNCLGYRLPLVNIIRTETGQTETADGLCHVPRLFRNAPGLHFVGRVHEQVYSSVLLRQADWAMDSGIGTATLQHFGYEPKVKVERDKVKRNLHLLELAEAEQAKPEPAFLMCYALDLFNDGQFEAALEKDREAFELLSQHDAAEVMPEVRERLVSVFCYHLLQAELYEELVEVATSQLALDCGPTTSIHYVHGLALMKLDRHEAAIEPLRKCIAKREEPAFTARFKGVEGPGPHHLLADCLAKAGQSAAAKAEFETALEMAPEATSVRWSFARFLTESGEPEQAVELLYAAIENSSIDCRLWSLGCNIVNGHLNDAEVALHWTDCAMTECTNHPEIGKQRGIALLTVGKFAEALECFEKAPRHPLNEGALILCQIATGAPARLGDPDKEMLISQAFVEWYRRLLERGQEAPARALAAQVDAIEAVLPTAGQVLREAVSVVD